MVVAQLPSLGHLPAPGVLSSVTLLPTTAINLGESTPTLAPPQHNQPTGNSGIVQQAKGVSLSPATEPFPPKLVERIRAGQFVEMRELNHWGRASTPFQASLASLSHVCVRLLPSHHGCLPSLPTWLSYQMTPPPVTCWPTPA